MSKIMPDPKLEALREEGLKKTEPDYDLAKMKGKATLVHASWLFAARNKSALQKLCLVLDGNRDSYYCPGWKEFGFHLGLDSEILNVIEWSKIGNEGYTYYVLMAFAQMEHSTIFKILETLQKIKRHDAVNRTYKLLENLAEDVLANHSTDGDSGYYSLSNSYRENDSYATEEIIKPDFTPTPPLILQNLDKVKLFLCENHNQPLPLISQESYQTANATREIHPPVKKDEPKVKQACKYDCKVMLTFANDGLKYAENIAASLRKKREYGQIGVLILNDHIQKVENNPAMFILGFFPQVDYVVPIITEGYIEAIMDTSSPVQNSETGIDCKYVRFIYDLMNKFYVNNGCLNTKIRSVVPDELLNVRRHSLMTVPIFEAWEKLSNLEFLAIRMLKKCSTCPLPGQQNTM